MSAWISVRRQHVCVGAVLLFGLCFWGGVLPAQGETVAVVPPPDTAICERLTADTRWRVTEIVDGDTVLLDNGREVRLVGLQAPKLALGRRHFQEWPLATEARDALGELVNGQAVTLYFGGREEDRHGRILAHLFLDDGRWVQGEMLAQGLARVYSFPDNRACIADMLAKEREARDQGVGIWSLAYYAIRAASPPEALLALEDSFQLVEGRVREVARVRNRVFLNFGENWRDDFTLVISGPDRRRFPADMESWVGRDVRVRGWIDAYNGPEIRLTHPEQLEWLGDASSF